MIRTRTLSTVTADPAWKAGQQMSIVLTLSTLVGTLVPSAIQIKITSVGSGGQWRSTTFTSTRLRAVSLS